VATLDDLLDVGDKQREQTVAAAKVAAGYLRVGVWSVGWLLAKTITLLLATVAGAFFTLGWVCARSVPALRWARTAFVLGWEAGRPPGGGRVPS
jgi:hypothetical protein